MHKESRSAKEKPPAYRKPAAWTFRAASRRDGRSVPEIALGGGLDADELAHAPAVAELHHAGHLGEERVVLAPADIQAGLDLGAALTDDDGTTGDQLSAEDLHAQPLCIGVAAVFGAS